MSKPRWIDGGVFRTLRSATRSRKLVVIVGPAFGSAEISSRLALKEALGDGDRASLADDPRTKSSSNEALQSVHLLRQPCVVTTAIDDVLGASFPEELETEMRHFGPDSKGLASVFDRKDAGVVHLHGQAADPGTLSLTAKDRRALTRTDSRYNAFLRQMFSRTVLFAGFKLDDRGLNELLEDVTRVFNGHVPASIALVENGAADPAVALRASMHFGMSFVEFPRSVGTEAALLEVSRLLEELEVPKPATGNPPRGFTELTEDFRASVPAATAEELRRFDDGDAGSWGPVKDGVLVARSSAQPVEEVLLGEVPEGKVRLVLVRGAAGDGKSTLMRKTAWDLACSTSDKKHTRIFWRESGSGLPDVYVPAEADDAVAVFVVDDADELEHLPGLLQNLASTGKGKARFLLAADSGCWERSGLDHRIRRFVDALDVELVGVDEAEAASLAEGLHERGRLAGDGTAAEAASGLATSDASLFGRKVRACEGVDLAESVAKSLKELGAGPESESLRKAYFGVALVHQHGMSLGLEHLAKFLGVNSSELAESVITPLNRLVVMSDGGALRTPHPMVATAAVAALEPDEATRDELLIQLLKSLPQDGDQDPKAVHAPSELIRARRQQPLPPLTLGRFFEAGEPAAAQDRQFWFDRGRYETDFARWDQALSAFDHALWKRPGDLREKEHNALVHANRARCLLSLNRKKEALRAVEEGLRQSSQDGSLLRLQEKLGGRRRPPANRGGSRGGARRGGGGGRSGGGGGRAGAGTGQGGQGGQGGRRASGGPSGSGPSGRPGGGRA